MEDSILSVVDRLFFVNWPPMPEKSARHIQELVENGYVVWVHYHKKGEPCNDECYTASSES